MVCTASTIDMDETPPYNNHGNLSHSPTTVKVEPAPLDLGHTLLHSPPPPSRTSSRRSTSTSSRSKRKYTHTSPRGELSIMTHPYGNWSSASMKSEQARGYPGGVPAAGSSRRSGSGDQQHFFQPESYSHSHDQYRSGDARHHTSSAQAVSSSLTGVMGDFGMSTSPHASPSGMAWTPSPTSGMPETYVLVPQDGNIAPYITNTPLHPDSPPHSMLSYSSYNTSYSTSGSSPTHVPGLPSPTGYDEPLSYSPTRQGVMPSQVISPPLTQSPLGMHMNMSPPPSATPGMRSSRSRSSQDAVEDELEYLRNRVHELEHGYSTERDKVKHLEQELTRVTYAGLHPTTGGLPTPVPSPAVSQSFNEGWNARREARIKLFCSLNRAGNALCAWHDSRRERRAHPPRMAPPGHLNCGCTYDEALFEESLARHGVGSYHPGENVRMDPALRNPLLKLLQERYGYRDGDFERDPITGEWLEGEGPARWEARASSGQPANKKIRLDDRR